MSLDHCNGCRGMRNYIDAAEYYNIAKIFWRYSELYGARPIKLSLIQPAEWFTSTVGEASDICIKEMISASRYTESDIIGILCPEYTGPLVKILQELGGADHLHHNRLAYFAPAYRYNRPQSGRLREFTQCGWEFFGPHSEAEVIYGAHQFLNAVGWKDYVLHINSIGTAEEQDNYSKILREYFAGKTLSPELEFKLQHSPLRLLDIDNLEYDIPEYKLSMESDANFSKLCSELDNLGVKYQVTSKLVRGLDYYENTVFEFHMPHKNQAILAGGRYYRITKSWPRVTQAIGWAAGIERLLEIKQHCSPCVWLIDMNNAAMSQIIQLRDMNIPVARYISSDIKKYLSKANKANIEWVLIIGEDEQANNTISWKNLSQNMSGQSTIDEFVQKYRSVQTISGYN